MSESIKRVPIEFMCESFPESCHICLIYKSDEQRQKIVSEYLAAGLRRGETVRYVTTNTSPDTVRSWLLGMGIELSGVEKHGAFGISEAESFYCPGGQFDPQKIIDLTYQRYELAKSSSFKGCCASGEMNWALKDIPGSERLIEYEVLLNTITTPFPHSGMCQYDARLFPGATLFKILQVHPYIIVQGQIVQNPYYIKPEEFLANYRQE